MKRTQLIAFRGKRTQQDMAKHYGVSQQSWSLWEKGESAPNVVTMKKLEEESGVPMESLFPDVFKEAAT